MNDKHDKNKRLPAVHSKERGNSPLYKDGGGHPFLGKRVRTIPLIVLILSIIMQREREIGGQLSSCKERRSQLVPSSMHNHCSSHASNHGLTMAFTMVVTMVLAVVITHP